MCFRKSNVVGLGGCLVRLVKWKSIKSETLFRKYRDNADSFKKVSTYI